MCVLSDNVTVYWQVRSWKTTLLQLLAPLFFLLLVTGLSYLPQELEDVPNPPVTPLGTLPRCKVSECVYMCVVILSLLRGGMESRACPSLPLDL